MQVFTLGTEFLQPKTGLMSPVDTQIVKIRVQIATWIKQTAESLETLLCGLQAQTACHPGGLSGLPFHLDLLPADVQSPPRHPLPLSSGVEPRLPSPGCLLRCEGKPALESTAAVGRGGAGRAGAVGARLGGGGSLLHT